MIYLLLSVATGTWLAVVFKIIARKRVRADVVITINYMAGTFSAALQCLGSRQVIRRQGGGQSDWVSLLLAGALLGLFMRANLRCTEQSTKENGVGSTTFFNRIGFFPCVLATALLWRESLGPVQCAGLVLVLIALLEMVRSLQRIRIQNVTQILWLIGSTAMIEFMNRIFSRYFPAPRKPLFLLAAFLAALAASLAAAAAKRKEGLWPTREEVLLGLALGVPNSFNILLKLKSLETVAAAVVFSVFAVGTMTLSVILGVAAFREKANKRTAVSIGLAAASIVLMCWPSGSP